MTRCSGGSEPHADEQRLHSQAPEGVGGPARSKRRGCSAPDRRPVRLGNPPELPEGVTSSAITLCMGRAAARRTACVPAAPGLARSERPLRGVCGNEACMQMHFVESR